MEIVKKSAQVAAVVLVTLYVVNRVQFLRELVYGKTTV